MAATIHVDIVSAEGHIHHGEAAMVFVPASQGEVGIAPRHAPLLTTLKPGVLTLSRPAVDTAPRRLPPTNFAVGSMAT